MVGAATAPPVYGADAERLAAVHGALEERLGAEAATARAQGRAMADQQVMAFVRREIERALSTRPG